MAQSDYPYTVKLEVSQDEILTVTGYRLNYILVVLCVLGVICSGGFLLLVFYWRQDWGLKCTHTRCAVSAGDRVLIQDEYARQYVLSLRAMLFDENGELVHTASKKVLQRHVPNPTNREIKLSGESSLWVINVIQQYGHIIYFKFKKVKFFWNPNFDLYKPMQGLEVGETLKNLHENIPLDDEAVKFRSTLYGSNKIIIHVPWIIMILIKEALTPFYVFQIFSVILWYISEYEIYATAIVIMSCLSLGFTVYETRTARVKLQKQIARESSPIQVCRQKRSFLVNADDLAPGDVIDIPPEGMVMLCDVVLLSGVCVVDESLLTGESVPVTKTALPQQHGQYSEKQHSSNTLLRGTRVLQARHQEGAHKPIRTVVIRTGWLTVKGSLLRSILYPKPLDFHFTKDALKFIGILALLSVAGMIYSFVILAKDGSGAKELVVKSLDLITIVVPPALPAAMSFGLFFALRRLKKAKVFCISPSSINMSGSIDAVVFDKTGTLTSEGLDIRCVIPSSGNGEFHKPATSEKELDPTCLKFIQGMSACHSINIIQDELVGHPLDVKMFQFTRWEMQEQATNAESIDFPSPPLFIIRPSDMLASAELMGLYRVFPFESSLQRMCVIVKVKNDSRYTVFVKGSPEMIASLCQKETLPENYENKYLEYANDGNRIIAMAFTTLSIPDEQVYSLNREEVELNLTFLGLIVCENRVKPESREVIMQLRNAQIRTVMATGDNLLTALSVARSCAFLDDNSPVYQVNWDYERNCSTVEECQAANSSYNTSNVFYRDIILNSAETLLSPESAAPSTLRQSYYLVLTGITWEMLRKHEPQFAEEVALMGAVFARMSSRQKAQVIETLQSLECYVAMCGDGANDCEALRTANSGISLSMAEASIASAFTSTKRTVESVCCVIREGRCALTTSFGIFKFMAAYSLIQFVSCLILYWIGSNLTDYDFLYIDLLIITPLSFTFGITAAYPVLHWQVPQIHLLSVYTFFVLGVHLIFAFICQVVANEWVKFQPWFFKFEKHGDLFYQSFEETAVFYVSSFQYIITCVAFSGGPPYRQPFYKNYFFLANVIIISVLTTVLVIQSNDSIIKLLEKVHIPSMIFKLLLLGLVLLNALASLIFEWMLANTNLFNGLRKSAKRPFEKKTREFDDHPSWSSSCIIPEAAKHGQDNSTYL